MLPGKEIEENIVDKNFYISLLEIPKVLKTLKFYDGNVELYFKDSKLIFKDSKRSFSITLLDGDNSNRFRFKKECGEKANIVMIDKPNDFIKVLSEQLKFTSSGTSTPNTIQFNNKYMTSTNSYFAMRTKVSLFISKSVNKFIDMMISEENIKFLLATKELIYCVEQYMDKGYVEFHNDDATFLFNMVDGTALNINKFFDDSIQYSSDICLLLNTKEITKANKYMKTVCNDTKKYVLFDGNRLSTNEENHIDVWSMIKSGQIDELLMCYDLNLMETILSTIATSNFSLNFVIKSNEKFANNVSTPIIIREKHDDVCIEDCKEFFLLPCNTIKKK